MPSAKSRRLVAGLLKWFSANARGLPWRCTRDPYAIWVSEIMLQQTRVKTVIPYWERWMRELPTIQSAAKASPAKLHKLWEGLGYYTRVRNLQMAAHQIIAKHGGDFPKNFDDILALTGIGRYTAGAIASIAFNQPRPILDGNVIRVLTRLFGVRENPRKKAANAQLWRLAEILVDRATDAKIAKKKTALRSSRPSRETDACSFLNQSLMELGALICTPRSPNCGVCPVQKLCVARRENLQDQLPNLGKRATATNRRFVAFVVERNRKFLVHQRPAGVVNAHLWEFPNVEVNGETNAVKIFETVFKTRPAALEKLCTVKHSITRYRITLDAYRVRLESRTKFPPDVWRTAAGLESFAFSSAHKKIRCKLSLTAE